MRKRSLIILLLCCSLCSAQSVIMGGSHRKIFSASFPATTLDASCSGNGTANLLACSSPMTVTLGDTITCNVTGVSGGNNLTGTIMDPINGWYDNVYGIVHPSSTTTWATTAVFQNSASGSITPELFFSNTPNIEGTISCYAWKGTPTANVLDGGGVEQTQTATSTNPTSGTATAPTNNNEVAIAYMSRSSGTAPSSGGGCWLPAGTLSLVGTTNVRQASEYCIQTTAAAVNGPFTATGSVAYVDSQLALLNNGTTGGYRALTGAFIPLGAPGSAPTGTISAASLGGATSTLASTHWNTGSPFWTLNGATAPTYDTTINPTGTKKIMVQQVAHTFGDAGSSVLYTGATVANNYMSIKDDWVNYGTELWLSFFYRVASSGVSSGQVCDIAELAGGVTDGGITLQGNYSTGSGVYFDLEPLENGSSQNMTFSGALDTDYWLQLKIAGVNERYHQLYVSSKSGATWSQVSGSPFSYDHLCTNGSHAFCTTPAAVVAPIGTASSGSTALTIVSGTSTANGQLVLDNVGNCIPWPTLVESGGTTLSITLSQNTTCGISATAVSFYTVPAGLSVATNGTVSSGSTALTVVAPGTGTIAVGQSVGGSGILQGTTVAAVSGTSVTLSQPAQSAMTNGGISFWAANGNGDNWLFGKFSSCSISSNQWWSALLYDPFGTWGAFEPN